MMFASLILLQRLKAYFPTAWRSSGHRLFVSAFMLASKVICDNTYSNKSSSIVGQGIFQLRQMCQYLEWELNVDLATLKEFEEMICKDFPGIGPCPAYILPSTKKLLPLPPSVIPFYPTCSISPSPSNKQCYMSPLKVPYVPSPPPYASPPETRRRPTHHHCLCLLCYSPPR